QADGTPRGARGCAGRRPRRHDLLACAERQTVRRQDPCRLGEMDRCADGETVMSALGSPASVAAAEAAYLKTRDARKAARRTKKTKAITGRGKTYEKRLQDAALKYLKTLPHVTAWKSGAGGFFSTYTSKKTGQTSSRFFRMGKKGCADIIGWVQKRVEVRIGERWVPGELDGQPTRVA